MNFIKRSLTILFTVSALAISLPSTAQTIEEIEVLAKQGNAKAQFDLAIILGDEASQNPRPDFTEELYWLKVSSAQGYAEAQYNMGLIYLEEYLSEPYGVKNDVKKGIELITKAANQGLPEAQSKLGGMYYYGSDVPQSYSKALEWYLKAANQDDHFSQLAVARMYYDGKGVTQNYDKSEEWRLRSVKDGNPSNQHMLGTIYSSGGADGAGLGTGAPLDYPKAVYWYTASANQGYSWSQYYLGRMYEEGKGLRQNYSTAKEWYGKACDNGLQNGCDKYKELKFKGY